MKPLIWATTLVFLFSYPVFAQDAHMWDSHFGTSGQLLGGLVVGAPGDLSAAFYNPAWLALDGQRGISISTRSAELYDLKVKNGFGQSSEPHDTRLVSSPSFLAGKFTADLQGDKVAIAYSYMQKMQFQYTARGMVIADDPAPPPEGSLWYSGEAYRDYFLGEHWVGTSFAKRIGKDIYLGISPYAILRIQDQRMQVHLKGLNSESDFAHVYAMESAYYYHVRALAKIGLAFDYTPVSFGFTFTTPSVGLFGLGDVQEDYSISGFDLSPEDGVNDLVLAVDQQDDLKPEFRSPFSVAAGAAWTVNHTRIYFSAEYFHGIDSYNILSPEPFSIQSNPDRTLYYDVSYATRAIINWGVAVSHQFSKTLTTYGSFLTDRSVIDQDANPTMMIGVYDNMHINVGASFEFKDVSVTTGVGYSFGNETVSNANYFDSELADGLVVNTPEQELSFKRIRFLIGLKFPFGERQ